MNYILFDDANRIDLLPLTFTRPMADLRVGILTIKEKWDRYLNTICSFQTEEYLSAKFRKKTSSENVFINASILPTSDLVKKINALSINELLIKNNTPIAIKLSSDFFDFKTIDNYENILCDLDFIKISDLWDIFMQNGEAIQQDFDLLTNGRKSAFIDDSNKVFCSEKIFVEEGANIKCAILNAESGPIYIGKDAVIMENSVVRGPFAMCEHSELKIAAKVYGPSTLGPYCKVGGEINNVVLQAYSSKAHDGFLGNAVIGEWCNLGADTNNSNLKNNYAEVKLWNYGTKRFKKTGLQFCGLIMGDHSKCAINTMFNTGTVIGVSANIFGSGFPRNFVPSFAWGGPQGMMEYALVNVFEVAELVMARRKIKFDDVEKAILENVHQITKEYRRF